jgi:hypothetical protein
MKESTPLKSKVSFNNQSWRFVTYDVIRTEGPFLIFEMAGEPVLTASIASISYYEPFRERSEGREAEHADLFSRR